MIFSSYVSGCTPARLASVIVNAKQLLHSNRADEAIRILDRAQKSMPEHTIRLKACMAQATVYFISDTDLISLALKDLASSLPINAFEARTFDHWLCHSIWCLLQFGHNALHLNSDARVLQFAHNLDLVSCLSLPSPITHHVLLDGIPSNRFFYCCPPRTGFFSYIEHVCLASYFSSVTKRPLVIDTRNWVYSCTLQTLMPSLVCEGTIFANSPESNTACSRAEVNREILLPLLFASLHHQAAYATWRIDFYQSFFWNSVQFLGFSDKELSLTTRPCIFLRVGDKIKHESISPSLDTSVSTIKILGDCMLLSDSSSLVGEIRARLSNHNVLVPDSKNPMKSGYHFGTSDQSVSAVMDILQNFIYMSIAPSLIACPSSNLVNAAFAARGIHGSRLTKTPLSIFRPTLVV
jgi:hypothetical protein